MNALNVVLLVEDNPGDARLVMDALRERLGVGCAVQNAPTLADGLLVLRDGAVDVVLLDLGLPDASGLEAFHEVRRLAPQVPVVILTGQDDDAQGVEAIRSGAEDYLAKAGADATALVRALRHAVQRRGRLASVLDAQSRLQAVAEIADEGIAVVDRQGRLRAASGRALELAGQVGAVDTHRTAPGAALRGSAALAGRVHDWVQPADHPALSSLLASAQPGERRSAELHLARSDGRACRVVAGVGVMPHTEGGGDPDCLLLLYDITEARLAADELQAMRSELEARVAERTARLEQANAELREINRSMAHDLRNPLNGIIGLTRLVRSDPRAPLPATAEHRLALLEDSALQMSETVSRLLVIGAAGRGGLHREWLDLSALARQIAQRLQEAEPARGVEWQIDDTPLAWADRVLLRSVLQNLLDNAWKYSAQRPVARIAFGSRSGADAGAGPGVERVWEIRDNGIGFAASEAPALFQPYERLAGAAGFPGTGLGLAGARRMVERHGGTIGAEGRPGQGSRFWFSLGAPERP